MWRRILHSCAEILWFCIRSGLTFALLQGPLPKLNYGMIPDFFQLPPGEHLVEPAGVAVNSKGHIYVFHRGKHPLMEFDSSGQIRTQHRRRPVRTSAHGSRRLCCGSSIGSGMSEESILAALTSGAKGYVDGGASAAEFDRAVRVVSQGSLWVPRRVLSMFVERSSRLLGRHPFSTHKGFTPREQQVLKMLLDGKSNKDISRPLGH
jgi:hypothetical protein